MPRQISEEITRKEMIDPQLETAGHLRGHSKVKIKIPMMVPPLNLQEGFAGVVARACPERIRRIESLRGRISAFEPRMLASICDALLSKLLSGDGEGVVL